MIVCGYDKIDIPAGCEIILVVSKYWSSPTPSAIGTISINIDSENLLQCSRSQYYIHDINQCSPQELTLVQPGWHSKELYLLQTRLRYTAASVGTGLYIPPLIVRRKPKFHWPLHLQRTPRHLQNWCFPSSGMVGTGQQIEHLQIFDMSLHHNVSVHQTICFYPKYPQNTWKFTEETTLS